MPWDSLSSGGFWGQRDHAPFTDGGHSSDEQQSRCAPLRTVVRGRRQVTAARTPVRLHCVSKVLIAPEVGRDKQSGDELVAAHVAAAAFASAVTQGVQEADDRIGS